VDGGGGAGEVVVQRAAARHGYGGGSPELGAAQTMGHHFYEVWLYGTGVIQ
jgi:hypothetical protein